MPHVQALTKHVYNHNNLKIGDRRMLKSTKLEKTIFFLLMQGHVTLVRSIKSFVSSLEPGQASSIFQLSFLNASFNRLLSVVKTKMKQFL